jgi:hypothetical protein
MRFPSFHACYVSRSSHPSGFYHLKNRSTNYEVPPRPRQSTSFLTQYHNHRTSDIKSNRCVLIRKKERSTKKGREWSNQIKEKENEERKEIRKQKRKLVERKKYGNEEQKKQRRNQTKIHHNFEMNLMIFPGHQPVLHRLYDDITQSLSAWRHYYLTCCAVAYTTLVKLLRWVTTQTLKL